MNLDIGYIVIGLVVTVFVVMVLREFTTWYFKIDQIVKLLAEIRDALDPPAPPAP